MFLCGPKIQNRALITVHMTYTIVAIFIIGYILIAIESYTKISKAAIALLMGVLCWVLYNFGFGVTPESTEAFTKSLGETCEILLFLMGAMAIVEVVDTNGGFNFVKEKLKAKSKKSLLWKLAFITFFLSAVLDNLTTSIVMIMVLNKIVSGKTDKLLYSSIVILAANSGGAFSPIGDVTTIMLWVKGNISTTGVLQSLFIPSVVSIVIPTLIVGFRLKGELTPATEIHNPERTDVSITRNEKIAVLVIGVGGLLSVPVFRLLTGLPPFMGIMFVLGILWVVTELIFHQKRFKKIEESRFPDVTRLLHKIDFATILFFLGILTSVSALSQTGVLSRLGETLDSTFNGNPYIVTGIIGSLSSVVDNVPLVASCMGMYDIVPATAQLTQDVLTYGVDGTFWELLAYCAGTGGSILIIGSAAGVVVMGLQKISFGWYMKNISPAAVAGYIGGVISYWLIHLI